MSDQPERETRQMSVSKLQTAAYERPEWKTGHG